MDYFFNPRNWLAPPLESGNTSANSHEQIPSLQVKQSILEFKIHIVYERLKNESTLLNTKLFKNHGKQ